MNICNRCFTQMDTSRYGDSEGICSACVGDLLAEDVERGEQLMRDAAALKAADAEENDTSLFLPVSDLGVFPISDHANTPTTDRNGVVLEIIGTVAFVVILASFALLVGKL